MLEFFVRTLFWQLFSSYMYIVKAAENTFVQKIRKFDVDEIDTRLVTFSRNCLNVVLCSRQDELTPTFSNNQLTISLNQGSQTRGRVLGSRSDSRGFDPRLMLNGRKWCQSHAMLVPGNLP
jgi:hypothetical protein